MSQSELESRLPWPSLLRSLSKWPSASQSRLPKRSGLRFEWQSVLRSRSELMWRWRLLSALLLQSKWLSASELL